MSRCKGELPCDPWHEALGCSEEYKRASKPIQNLAKAYASCYGLLRDRGYVPLTRQYTWAEFLALQTNRNASECRRSLTIVAEKDPSQPQNPLPQYMVVTWALSGGKDAIHIVQDMYRFLVRAVKFETRPGLMIVLPYHQSMSSAGRVERARFAHRMNIKIEIIMEDFLIQRIVDHSLVPPHERMTEEDLKFVAHEHHREPQKLQFPAILPVDPVSRWHGFQEGEVLRIRAKDGIGYRRVTAY